MNALRRFHRVRGRSCATCLTVFLLALSWMGCRPGAGAGKQEDQNVQAGNRYLMIESYDQAEQAFQRALQNNPNSSDAHWGLGALYFQQRKDYTGALYHVSRYAQLRTNSNKDQVDRMIQISRQEIAKQIPLFSRGQDRRAEISQLQESNDVLRKQIERLQRNQPVVSPAPSPLITATPQPINRPSVAPATPGRPTTAEPSREPANTALRTHRIRAGETFHSVARQYNLDPERVIAANPTADPHNLQIGQVIRLPNR